MKISYEMLPKNVNILPSGIPQLYIITTRVIGRILINRYNDCRLLYT